MKAIEFHNVGKQYRLGLVSTGTFSHDLGRWWTIHVLRKEDPYLRIGETNDRSRKGQSDYVWALRDISFELEEGDVVGIIGKNGAGKSTLLKLLSRVTAPTVGSIRCRGRIASLLEVGTGFHPEMTGRENIYMNGAIMGMTKAEISRKFDEIVAFSGCERYVDTPVKRYSSGMTVRLGFAIAAHLEPEILVVDEVLAVGDAEFQKKAIGKMQDVAHSGGRTVLFVSHNMAAIRSLCSRGVVLDKGEVAFIGSTSESVDYYLGLSKRTDGKRIVDLIEKVRPGMSIESIEVNGTENPISDISSGQETMSLKICGTTDEDLLIDVMLMIKNRSDVVMASLAEGHCKGKIQHIQKGKFVIERTIKLPRILSTGDYVIDLYLHHPMVEGYMRACHCAEIHIDGFQEGFGRSLRLQEEGFVGLESV